jgi:hypothetical protein
LAPPADGLLRRNKPGARTCKYQRKYKRVICRSATGEEGTKPEVIQLAEKNVRCGSVRRNM